MARTQRKDEIDAGPPATAAEAPATFRSGKLLFPNDPNFVTPRVRRMIQSRQYEARETSAVRALVRPEDVAVELGAGIGYMSTLMARACGAKAVHAFEANPSLIPYIRRVHELNGISDRAQVTNALLGRRKGTVSFYERENFLASSLDPDEPGVINEHRVEVLNIKTVMQDIRPSVLVCDIEGAEADILPAADLSSLRLAVVELHPQWIGRAGVQAVFDAFAKVGLSYYPRRSDKKVVTFRKDW